jgi:hypothetical protein
MSLVVSHADIYLLNKDIPGSRAKKQDKNLLVFILTVVNEGSIGPNLYQKFSSTRSI